MGIREDIFHMDIFEIMHFILENKVNRGIEDFVDIRLSREQAWELYDRIHRIITYEKNMGGKKDDRD